LVKFGLQVRTYDLKSKALKLPKTIAGTLYGSKISCFGIFVVIVKRDDALIPSFTIEG
jgi:hypothetical protein